MTDQFTRLIEKKKEEPLLDFLRTLTPQDKKALVPVIKKLDKHYHEAGPLGGGSYGYVNGTDAQRAMILLAGFVCFSLTDFDKMVHDAWMIDKKRLAKVIDWYCPDWFSDFVNKQAEENAISWTLEYFWLMELTQRGFLHPARLLIVRTLPQTIFENIGQNQWQSKPEVLLKLPITLEEHIWYLFELESNVHSAERYLYFGSPNAKKAGWLDAFKDLVAQQKIDRFRVLQESLLASNRNFNQALSGWFAELFATVKPTDAELLRLQKELLSVLGSPHSKPVNTALQGIKKIVAEKTFDAQGLLDATPLLLASDTKATVASLLAALEKLGQSDSVWRGQIAKVACQSFIHQQEELQTKAAKLIAKFGDAGDTKLRQEIASFRSNMLAATCKTLAAFLDVQTANDTVESIPPVTEPLSLLLADPIPFPATIDDLVFLASQAFDNNEPWHLDALCAALVHFAPELKQQDLPLFEPAFQRAIKTLKGEVTSNCGVLDRLLAAFFTDFGEWLISKFGAAAPTILPPSDGAVLAKLEFSDELAVYKPYKYLLLEALEKIRNRNSSPMLSMPTHTPCWISPEVLIDRLRQHQQTGRSPANMDLQIAISRCTHSGNGEALNKVSEQLEGELKALMIFLLDEHATPAMPLLSQSAWLVAALTRKDRKMWPEFRHFALDEKALDNYTGHIQWQSFSKPYMTKRWDYETRRDVEEPAVRKILTVDREYQRTGGSLGRKLFFGLLPRGKFDSPFLYPLLQFKIQYSISEQNDIKRLLSLIPHNPEPLVADTINKCLQGPVLSGESEKRTVSAVEQFLHSTWRSPGPMTNLFLATCMLASDKTVAATAAEIWLQAVSMGLIDNVALGSVIGRHESIEFAPLKRFTDLVSQHMLKVSRRHDEEIKTLIEQMLPYLPDEPIKNLKKLLELYSEVIAINKASKKPQDVLAKLKRWEENSSLKRTILSIP